MAQDFWSADYHLHKWTNTLGAYIERIVLFMKTTEIGIIVQHMASRSSICRST